MISRKPVLLLSIVMSVILLASPLTVLADGSGTVQVTESKNSGSVDQSKPNISLEKAIEIVKQNFEIPAQLTNFGSDYSNDEHRQVWSLHWNNPQDSFKQQDPVVFFEARVDAATGEIVDIFLDQEYNSQGAALVLPSLTEEAAQKIAADLLNRLAGDKMPELQLQKGNDSLLNLNNYSPSIFNFYWQRIVNNIPFSGDGITIQVNGNNGKVMHYSRNWTNTGSQLPDVQNVISNDKARQIFQDNSMLELQYFQPFADLPLTGMSAEQERAKLVYGLNSKYSNGAIDAFSGKPIKSTDGWYNFSQGNSLGMDYIYMAKDQYREKLSRQEQEDVANQAQLISQNEAVKAATQWITLPDDVKLQNSSLGTFGQGQKKVWDLGWISENKDNPEQMVFINAAVDARTGELLHFSRNLRRDKIAKGQISRDKALLIAQDFLQKIQPHRCGQVKLMEQDNPKYAYDRDGVQMFCFNRIANNIPFYNNSINISVDTVNKSIMDYSFNWSDLELPVPEGILSAAQANTTYLNSCPLTLKYVQMHKNEEDEAGQPKLYYVPTPVSDLLWNMGYLDAKSGNLLDLNGQLASEMPKPYCFNDITGNFAEKEITLLGQAGIFGENNNQFKPDDNLNLVSLLRALLIVQEGVWSTYMQSDQNILLRAQKQGWVAADCQPSDPANREIMAETMIKFLKLTKVARLKDVFNTPYSDIADFPAEAKGYISLAKALGLFHFEGDKFIPEQPVSRAEAAYALVKALTFAGQSQSTP